MPRFFFLKIGTTKFNALNELNRNKDVENIYDEGVYKTPNEENTLEASESIQMIRFHFKHNNCIKSDNNFAVLYFRNNSLYRTFISYEFKPENYDQCLENYHKISKTIKKNYPIQDEKIISVNSNQVGECVDSYKKETEKVKMKKGETFEHETVSYRLKYEDSSNNEYKIGNGKIRGYILELLLESTNYEIKD